MNQKIARTTALAAGLSTVFFISACGQGAGDGARTTIPTASTTPTIPVERIEYEKPKPTPTPSTATAPLLKSPGYTTPLPDSSGTQAPPVTPGNNPPEPAPKPHPSSPGLTATMASCSGHAYATDASAQSRPRLYAREEKVAAFVLALHRSNYRIEQRGETKRVEAVLRKALTAAAIQYPGNPFSTQAAQSAVRIHHAMSNGAVLVDFGKDTTEEDAVALMTTLRRDPQVRYVELDRVVYQASETKADEKPAGKHDGPVTYVSEWDQPPAPVFPDPPGPTPNDSLYIGFQWNLEDSPVGINIPNAWKIQKAAPDVITAIIDTGYSGSIDLDDNRISTGLTMLASKGIVSPDAIDISDKNRYGRGIEVAGVISAVTDNFRGMAGVGWNAKFVPINVFAHNDAAKISDVAEAIRWAAGMAVPEISANIHPAKIINLSLSGYDDCGETLQSAIDDVVKRGVNVVAAAGNQDMPAAWSRPGNCRNVITVGGSDQAGQRYVSHEYLSRPTRNDLGSNYGQSVSISAPAVGIATTPAREPGVHPLGGHASLYRDGTSFAAPQVAGVIALMLSANPRLKPMEIRKILEDTARTAVGDSVESCRRPAGAGIVDAGAAVSAAKALL